MRNADGRNMRLQSKQQLMKSWRHTQPRNQVEADAGKDVVAGVVEVPE